MDFVGGAAHAVRELGGVGHQAARDGVAAVHFRPAVVEDEVLVPGVFESEIDHCVGGLHDLRLVNIAKVGVLVGVVSTHFASELAVEDWTNP